MILTGPRPQTVLLRGPTGSGKSSLIRTLSNRTPGHRLYVVFRVLSTGTGENGLSGDTPVAVRLFDPDGATPKASETQEGSPSAGTGPTWAHPTSDRGLPHEFSEAYARLRTQGGGVVFVDEWTPDVEASFAQATPQTQATEWISTRASELLNTLGRERVSMVISTSHMGGEGIDSLAGEIIELTDEAWDGPPFRIMRFLKHFWGAEPDPTYIYRLDRGQFVCEEPMPGVPDHLDAPDPEPPASQEGIWPGSSSFAATFGALRYHSLTGVVLAPELSNNLTEAITHPAMAHVLRSGGRVLWIPPASTLPMQACGRLGQVVPRELMQERLRILSAAGQDPAMGDLRSVVLALHRVVVDSGDVRSAMGTPVGPLFRDAHQFLQGTPSGKPALFVLHFDGLRALAISSQIGYDTNTFPMVMAQYARLPGFHGLGFAHAGDPLAMAATPSASTLLHLDERHGRTILYGVRPRTPALLLLQQRGHAGGAWQAI